MFSEGVFSWLKWFRVLGSEGGFGGAALGLEAP